jgi:hypothetical protein
MYAKKLFDAAPPGQKFIGRSVKIQPRTVSPPPPSNRTSPPAPDETHPQPGARFIPAPIEDIDFFDFGSMGLFA